ncbi:hypothetical protein GQ53DRAFT_715107 [Thozetella sp. PMI_491]|nr:hypothetical protein GQ53DRAFT_715107 [Thozetella sp. PMI_491]
MSSAESSAAEDPSKGKRKDKAPRKREFVTRSRTGCITCRIRRVRCDEQKPFCNRCLSTGRKCDGYGEMPDRVAETSLTSRATGSATGCSPYGMVPVPRHPRVALPRSNEQELRSYQFFVDVTAPTLAGVFDSEFWMTEIPRICHYDPAIWHATVSLGAVHENYNTAPGTVSTALPADFATRQFNASIKHLTQLSSSQDLREERWRALTASILFAYLSSLQGLQAQSELHLTAAKNMIKELENDMTHGPGSGEPIQARIFKNSPVPYENLRSIVANLEFHNRYLKLSGMTEAPTLLDDINMYASWRYYSAPRIADSSTLCMHGKCVPSRATPENLARASQVFESLLNALFVQTYQNIPEVGRLAMGDDHMVNETLAHRKQAHARAFGELNAAVNMFVLDTISPCSCFELPDNLDPRLATAAASSPRKLPSGQPFDKEIDTLRLFQATCAPLIHNRLSSNAPAEVNLPTADEQEMVETRFTEMLDIAERVLKVSSSNPKAGAPDFVPNLSVLRPLLIVGHNGSTMPIRRRALELLRRYPRLDGLLDSALIAALLEVSMQRELELAEEARQRGEPVPMHVKMYEMGVNRTGARSARVEMQSWGEYLENRPGTETVLTW